MARLVVELRIMKAALGGIAAAIVLAAIAWSCSYLYWHVKIVGALRTLETPAGSAETQAATDVLNEAGCRSLPYLVGSLDPKRNTLFLALVTTQIALATGDPGEPIPTNAKVREHLAEWRIEQEDSPAERQRKCGLIREWWRENGGRHHRTWRVWSSLCAR